MGFGKRGNQPPRGVTPPSGTRNAGENGGGSFSGAGSSQAQAGSEFYQYVPPPPPRPVMESGKSSQEPSGLQALLGGIFQAVILLGILGSLGYIALVFAPKPIYTTSAKKVYYNWFSIGQEGIYGHDKEYRRKHGFSIEGLVIRPNKAHSALLRKATEACRQQLYPSHILVSQAPLAYGPAMEYITCMMKTNKERFCDPRERKVLVKQLKTYSHIRQAVLGLERARDLMLKNNPLAVMALRRQRKFMSLMKGRPIASPFASIGKRVHPEVIIALTRLIEDGYIRKDDFSWMGITLPEDYAPAFAHARHISAPKCR